MTPVCTLRWAWHLAQVETAGSPVPLWYHWQRKMSVFFGHQRTLQSTLKTAFYLGFYPGFGRDGKLPNLVLKTVEGLCPPWV